MAGLRINTVDVILCQADKFEAFEMTCYRCMFRISWKDHRTNESVLKEISANREFVTTIRKRKLQYFGHMIWAQNLCTHIFEGRLDGTRSRERPTRWWDDSISDRTSKNLAECMTLAKKQRETEGLVCHSLVSDLQQWRKKDSNTLLCHAPSSTHCTIKKNCSSNLCTEHCSSAQTWLQHLACIFKDKQASLGWFENPYSSPLSWWAIMRCKVGHNDPVFLYAIRAH